MYFVLSQFLRSHKGYLSFKSFFVSPVILLADFFQPTAEQIIQEAYKLNAPCSVANRGLQSYFCRLTHRSPCMLKLSSLNPVYVY